MTYIETSESGRPAQRRRTRKAIVEATMGLLADGSTPTVAEIADAANVSVKTLFVYFRSKEDLVFTDTWLLDLCLDALRGRLPGTGPGEAIAGALRLDETDRRPAIARPSTSARIASCCSSETSAPSRCLSAERWASWRVSEWAISRKTVSIVPSAGSRTES